MSDPVPVILPAPTPQLIQPSPRPVIAPSISSIPDAVSIARDQRRDQRVIVRRWAALCDYLELNFYRPDTMALDIALTVCAAQFEPQMESIWLFVVGPSGSGKTSIIINCCSDIPNAHILGKITPHTFLSGFTGKKDASLLQRIQSGILLFKDFTTILSLRQESRTEIASQIREIADGYFCSDTGSKDKDEWRGKMSAIAAVTPIIEHYWALLRNMGDRFIQVRWPRLDGMKTAEMSRKQQGREHEIAAEMRRLTLEFFAGAPKIAIPPPDLSDAQARRLSALAEIVSHLRANVERATEGAREIKDMPQIEQTGRLGKALPALARFHAALHRKPAVDDDDLAIAIRVALDSIPYTRMKVIEAIPPDDVIGAVDVRRMLGITESALKWTIDELIAVGAVVVSENLTIGETVYRMSDHIREMWGIAFPQTLTG